jgi:hypothetical protein
MGGNPGENLILFVFYISLIGLAGAVVVVLWIKISDYIVGKKSKKATPEEDSDPIEISE